MDDDARPGPRPAHHAALLRRLGLILALLGLPITALAGWLVYDEYTFRARAAPARATVVANEQHIDPSSDGSTAVYSPTLQFEDAEGRLHRVKKRARNSEWDWDVGDEINVLYLADRPQEVRPDEGFWMTWMNELIVGSLGVGGLVMGFAANAAGRSQLRSAARPSGPWESARRWPRTAGRS